MNWLRQVLTGRDNETVAIGRLLGLLIATLFIFGLPLVAVVTMILHQVDIQTWGVLLDKLPVYLTALILSVGGLIGLTAPSEPK